MAWEENKNNKEKKLMNKAVSENKGDVIEGLLGGYFRYGGQKEPLYKGNI